MVALIPARAGSKRCPGKNTRLLGGVPVICWTIQAALESGVFEEVHISSEDRQTFSLVQDWFPYRTAQHLRDPSQSTDEAPDILWVREALQSFFFTEFAILRPTSPFRTADTIRRAYKQFKRQEVHSIRAVEPARQHPGKMWTLENGCLKPVYGGMRADGTPYHSAPTQTLPEVYIQNASLEMAWTYVLQSFGTISGKKIAPFFTEGYEGFDINTEEDWREAERLVASGAVAVPTLATPTP